MDKFDRELQHDFLLALYASSPNNIPDIVYKEFEEKFGGHLNFIANIYYLKDHGLLTCKIEEATKPMVHTKHFVHKEKMIITSKGIDFIRDDGGLGAILNVVNIKLHNDTINRLEEIIRASNAAEADKSTLISTLRKLPADAIKHLNLKLLDTGLAHLPDVFHAIQSAMHGL